MMFLAAFVADLAGVKAIVGAFLAGLAFNRIIPQSSVLMNRLIFIQLAAHHPPIPLPSRARPMIAQK